MNNSRREGKLSQLISTSILSLLVLSLLCGCEPLRKKFTRKKKKEGEVDFVPVLQPIEYPSQIRTKEDLYKHYYSLWQVWHRDILTAFLERAGDKKLRYILKEIILNLDSMQQLLLGEKHDQLVGILDKLKRMQAELESPAPLRNSLALETNLRSLEKKIRLNFKFPKVEDSLTERTP